MPSPKELKHKILIRAKKKKGKLDTSGTTKGTPSSTPRDTPGGTPIVSPKGTPKGTPRGTPRGTPIVSPKETPKGTPRGTPKDTPGGTPIVSPKGTPKQTLKCSPKESFRDTSNTQEVEEKSNEEKKESQKNKKEQNISKESSCAETFHQNSNDDLAITVVKSKDDVDGRKEDVPPPLHSIVTYLEATKFERLEDTNRQFWQSFSVSETKAEEIGREEEGARGVLGLTQTNLARVYPRFGSQTLKATYIPLGDQEWTQETSSPSPSG